MKLGQRIVGARILKVCENLECRVEFECFTGRKRQRRYCSVECGKIMQPINRLEKAAKEFIEKAQKVHSDRYDYSKFQYKGSMIKSEIICKVHGSFLQWPTSHISGQGCIQCKIEKTRYTTHIFIKKAQEVHKDKYDYSKTIYTRICNDVEIFCKEKGHGYFRTNASNHLAGVGCPICKESKGERKIRHFLQENNIDFISQKTFENCKYIHKLSFDFYLPDHNLLIEFDGQQHYKDCGRRYGGQQGFELIQKRDKIKNDFCKENDIPLLRIRFDEFNQIEEILLRILNT